VDEILAHAAEANHFGGLMSQAKGTVVIVVARLGKGEVSRVYNHKRLFAAKQYLSQYGLPVQNQSRLGKS
jgi:hypothetical protein